MKAHCANSHTCVGTILTVPASQYDVEVLKTNLDAKLKGISIDAQRMKRLREKVTYKTVENWDIDVLVEVAWKPLLIPLDASNVWSILT